MRKLLFIAIAFAALALAGCEQERFGEGVQDGVLTTVTAGREAGPATRSALTEDGDNYWSVGDKILVAWAGQKPNVFTSKEKEPGETAKWKRKTPMMRLILMNMTVKTTVKTTSPPLSNPQYW